MHGKSFELLYKVYDTSNVRPTFAKERV